MLTVNLSTWNPNIHVLRAKVLGLFVVLILSLVASNASRANHNEDECHKNQSGCTPTGDIQFPFTPPAKKIEWELQKRANLWVAAWRPFGDTYKTGWDVETYDPKYVHPKQFIGQFYDQCQNEIDWDYFVNSITSLKPKVQRYQWSVDGVVRAFDGDCYWQDLPLGGQGIHDVKLEVFKVGAATPYLTKTEDVRVRDFLIVLMGDSAASGEGSPEEIRFPQTAEWGKWVDRRCHRSSKAAVPLAVKALEGDPHSTVTFLDFACSGATIKLSEAGQGVGILGKYTGVEPVVEDAANQYYWLPSQIDQLAHALITGSPVPGLKRKVDMLFTTGGINDVRFAKLATACLLLEDCQNKYTPFFDAQANPVKIVFDDLAAQIPGAFVDMKTELDTSRIDVDKVFVMQYPGAFENQNGGRCTEMLEDVLPWSSVARLVFDPGVAPFLPLLLAASPILEAQLGANPASILATALTGNLNWMPDEINWMIDHAMPTLDKAVSDGAKNAGFTFIGGIRDAFAKHGYCATDNWIQRASQSSYQQGPWNFLAKPLNVPIIDYNPLQDVGLGINAGTKGLMHPGPKGYVAWADVLKPTMDTLRNHTPIAKDDFYQFDPVSVPVFDTGFGAGILINDYDPDNDPVRTLLVTAPSNGSVVLDYDGHLVYKPNTGFYGNDSLEYVVSDGGLTSQKARVTFSVGSNRNPPKPAWKWSYPTGDFTPVVNIGGSVEFPICNNCGDMVLRIEPQPGFGKVVFARGFDRFTAIFTQNGITPGVLPYLDVVAVDIGRMVGIVFVSEGRAEIPVRIEGTVPAWSWIFRTPENVIRATTTQFDLCDNCGDLVVRLTNLPQSGTVAVKLDLERNRWVAQYSQDPASEYTSDGFGVEIGTITGGDIFTPLDSTRVGLAITP